MALPLRPRRPIHHQLQCLTQQLRQFSLSQRQANANHTVERIQSNLPEYPYGPSRWYKQSNFGLYGNLKISSGNNVSSKTETKTRRKWRPNVQMKRLYSHALNRYIRVKVATRVLRTVDKCGGLDEYLVGEKPARIKELGLKGWELRCKVMKTSWWLKRKMSQREEWGLSPVRTYYPEEKEDEKEGGYLVGMFGEKVQEPEEGETDTMSEELRGKYHVQPEPKYVSGKLKRRAIVKKEKELRAEARAAAMARQKPQNNTLDWTKPGRQGLRAYDLRQHIDYEKKRAKSEPAPKTISVE